jgi:hypothetical protein
MAREPESFNRHPSGYVQAVFRGIVHEVIEGGILLIEVDLGFGQYMWRRFSLFNLALPQDSSAVPVEQRAAHATMVRLVELIFDKPVLFVTYEQAFDQYSASVFFYIDEARKTKKWYSLEARLVEEGHAAWQDATIVPPSLD